MAVVGGGLVGIATALALVDGGAGRVVVLEAEAAPGRHQSGRNSGVVHSGLYYRPGSLKAALCVRGRRALEAFCADVGLPLRRTGKLVVAAEFADEAALAALAARGRANGLEGLEWVDAEGIAALATGIAGVRALHVPETGITDFGAVTRALATRLEARGGRVRVGWPVREVEERAGEVQLRGEGGALLAGAFVNCAGLQADRVAHACGLRPEVRIVPFRGHYFRLRTQRTPALRLPVYPVPDPALPFLGIHVHPTLSGAVVAGPNAVLALSRSAYHRFAFAPRDVWDTLGFPGFWRLARRHAGRGIREAVRLARRTRFVADLRRLMPDVRASDLEYAGFGIRAQAVDRAGRLLDDFRFERGRRSLHVLNSPSPGATAALAIGEHVAGRLMDELG